MTKTPKNIVDEQGLLDKEYDDYKSLKQLSTALAYPGRSDQFDYARAMGVGKKGKTNTLSRKIYDATAFRGFEIWGNGVVGNFMPKETNWFMERMSDKKMNDSKAINRWLQELDEHLRYVLATSKDFYGEKLVRIKDSGCIGDSFLYLDKDPVDGKLLAKAPHPREFRTKYDWWGRVLHIHHKYEMSIQEVIDEPMFGEKALSATQRVQKDKNQNQKITIIHAVYRNKDYNPYGIGVKDMLWQHYYVNADAEKEKSDFMYQTGTHVLNPVPWPLNKPSHESYGRGIVSQMLIEILTANFISKDMLLAGQLAARPPMLMSAAVKNKLDMGAGAINYMKSKATQGLKMGDLIARLIDSSGYPFGADNQMRWQSIIEQRFGVPLFLALSMGDGKRTLGEARMVQAERTVLMAPFLATICTTTDMELDRVYSLEAQSGDAPEPPQELLDATNGRINVQYIGPLFQLLKQYYETGSLLTTIANIREVYGVAPDSAYVVEGDELMRKILKSNNTPEDIIRDPQAVEELRAIAAQQEELKMQAELAEKTSKVVPNLSKKIENDSVLKALQEAA